MTALIVTAGVASVVASVVVVEWLARRALQMWGGYYRYPPYSRARLEIDRTALPALSPVARVRINRDGERGDEPPASKASAWRALVVGGSAAECYFLDQDESWPAVLQQRLRQPDALRQLGVAGIHVGNIARAILPCEQICVLLSRTLPRYDALDAIFIMVGASDVVRWLENQTPATVEEGSFSLDSIFEQHPEGPWHWSPKRTALWRCGSMINSRVRRPDHVVHDAGGWLHRVRKMHRDAPTFLDYVADPAPMLGHFDKFFRELIKISRSKARRVIVIRQPWFEKTYTSEEASQLWNFGLGRAYTEQVSTYCTPDLAFALLRAVDDRAAAIAVELGVEQLDVMSAIERSTASYYDMLHLTPAGARVVGDAAAAVVLEGGN